MLSKIFAKPLKRGLHPIDNKILTTNFSDLIFFHNLTEKTGATAFNQSSHAGLDAVYINTALANGRTPWGQNTPLFNGLTSGVDGDGNQAALQAAWTDRTEFSVMTWAKMSGASVWDDDIFRSIVEMKADGDNSFSLSKRVANQIRFVAELNSQVYAYSLDGVSPADWFSVGFRVFDAGGGLKTLAAYFNGVLVGSDTEVTQNWITAPDKYTIGTRQNVGSRWWDGFISSVAMWNGDIGDTKAKYVGSLTI